MRARKSKLVKFLIELFMPGLPKNIFSFRFSYYYKFRDPKNNIVNQERIWMEFGSIYYSYLSEDLTPKNQGDKPVLLKKVEEVLYLPEEYDKFYSFLRRMKFHRIRDPKEHVSTYPGAPSVFEEMELEVHPKANSKKDIYASCSGDDMRVSGESEKIFEHTKGYIGNLIRKHFSNKQ